MIYCPHCGTPNKPNSKFCKNCAALLAPSTDVRCPICGTMNPQSASSCSNCGTRLTTGSAGATSPSEPLTPADSPEQIAPFNPPSLPPEPPEADAPEPPPLNRPSFARANSEWLRRIQKTPPPTTRSARRPDPNPAPVPPASPETPRQPEPTGAIETAPSQDTLGDTGSGSVSTPEDTRSDWLTALDAQQESAAQPDSPAPTGAETPAAPSVSDTSPFADTVLDAGSTASTMAAGTPTVPDSGATADTSAVDTQPAGHKLPGLDLAVLAMADAAVESTPPAETAPGTDRAFPGEFVPPLAASSPKSGLESASPAQDEPADPTASGSASTEATLFEVVTPVQTPATKPVIGEIKLTGDDYDYSDIGGEVTDEVKAQLDAHAGNLSSMEDEVALARRLLGLDVGGEAPSPVSAVPPAAMTDQPPAVTDLAPVSPDAGITAQPTEPPTQIADTPPIVSQTEPPTAEPAKPVIGEIKLTGDDYDYSDIGGEVTDEVKAQLDAHAGNLSSMEDEVALARRLLGLDTIGEAPSPGAPVSPASESLADEGSSPAWLTALAAASSAAVAGQVTDEHIIPDTGTTEGAITSGETAPAKAPAEEAAPDKTSVPPAAPVAGAPNIEGGDLPDWLQEIAPPHVIARQAAGTPADADARASEEMTDEGELPAWVQELAPEAGSVTADKVQARLPELDESERQELPDWLREPLPAPVQPAEPEPPVPAMDEGETVQAEPEMPAEVSPSTPGRVPPLVLPSWITGSAPGTAPVRDPFETIETTGPLAGVSGILPLAIAITEPHILTSPAPTRSDGGRIFQTIVAEPLAVTPDVRTQAQAGRLLSSKRIIYLVILLAALVPLFLPLNNAGLGLDATKSPTALVYDQLQAVPENGTVLMAFDYSPGQAVELAPAARVIANALAARHVNVIAVSTNETGATLAQDVLAQTLVTNPNFTFVNVGYIFGREARLSEFAKGWLPANQPLPNGGTWGALPLAQRVQGMNDLGLTVLLTADENDLRMWMEQAGPYVTSPIVAAASAQLEPPARNYVNAKQLRGFLRGLTGAAELELLTNTTGQTVKTVDALSFVSLVLAGIIIVANLMGLSRRGKKA